MTKIDGGLRQLFRSHLPDFFWTSIETGAASPSVPDSHYLRDGASGWIEFKKTEASKIPSLKPEQASWLHRYDRCGGRSWLATRRRHYGGPRLGDPVDELWFVPGGLAPEVLRLGLLGVLGVARWGGGPAGWDWDEVRRMCAAPRRRIGRGRDEGRGAS